MHHRNQMYLLLASIVLVVGCDSGVQRGQYVVGGSHGERFANGGWITKLTGTPSEDLTAPDRLLIAFQFVGPDFYIGAESHQTYLSSLYVETPSANFAIEWNRSSETVKIGHAEYDRPDGNIFVVRIDSAGLSSYQVRSLVNSEVTEDILMAVKNERPNGAEAQTLAPKATP